MKRIKRLLLAGIGAIAVLALAIALLTLSSPVVFADTSAEPSDAFRPPDLAYSSFPVALRWNDTTGSAQLSTLEMDRLGAAWADAFELIERRSNGETVDFTRRFHDSIALLLGAPRDTTWSPFAVVQHDVTLDLVSSNRQVVALTVQVEIDHIVSVSTVRSIDTYQATFAHGANGWLIVTFNRTGTLPQS